MRPSWPTLGSELLVDHHRDPVAEGWACAADKRLLPEKWLGVEREKPLVFSNLSAADSNYPKRPIADCKLGRFEALIVDDIAP